MGEVVLLTGGTGFLGTEVAARLLERADLEIVSLVLADSDAEAVHASNRAWWYEPDLRAELGARIHAIAGDVAEPRLGLDPSTYADLCERVTHIVHSAADLRVDATVEDLRGTNVDGVANVLELRAVGPQARTPRPRVDRIRGRGSEGNRERGRPDRRLRLREPVRADEVRGRTSRP